MRNWGILVTVFYALIVLFLVVPIVVFFSDSLAEFELLSGLTFLSEGRDAGFLWYFAVTWLAALIGAQALLLFVSVDTSFRRVHPRRHIMVSAATTGLAVSLLTSAAVASVVVAFVADDWPGGEDRFVLSILFLTFLAWFVWGLVFYRFKGDAPDRLNKMTRWLIRGSVLELLVAVPSHIIVRSRGDCSAPLVSGYGIATGIAVMLLAFGPAVLFLYQKRLAGYQSNKSAD